MPDTITAAVPQQTPPQNAVLHPAQVYFLSRRLPDIVHLVQYDQSLPYLAVELYEGDEPYTVPDGAAVNIRMAKPVPSTKKVYNPAYGISSDRHTVYIQVTPQMTVVAGCTNPVIEVVVDGGIACTGTLRLEIDPNPVQESDIIDTDEYLTIQEILAQVQAAAQIVQDNEQALQDVHNNLAAIQNAAANAQAAAASAQDAEDAADRAAIEAQKALGFRSYYGGQVVPDANGDLDPSRPMSTPTAASVTIKARGDRIAGLTMAGKTTQEGTGDPSPDNIRPISGVGMYDKMLVLDGSSDERWEAFLGASGVFYIDLLPEYGLSEDNSSGIKVNRLKYNKPLSAISEDEFYFQSSSISTSALRFIIKVDNAGTNVQTVRDILGKAPLTVWYRSTDYYKSTGPFYTVVELSQNPYRAVGFELTQPLFDGDTLQVGVPSGCDQMIVLDGSADEQFLRKAGGTSGFYYFEVTTSLAPVIPQLTGTTGQILSDLYPALPTDMGYKGVKSVGIASNGKVCIFDPNLVTETALRDNLAAHPLTIFYRSTEYTEENDIPVALESHTYELATPVSYARPIPTMIAQPGEDGTFTVTGENSLSVLLKPFQDGGDAATIEGHTWADILAATQAALLAAYPVGSIYMSMRPTDPGTLFGGKWKRLGGKFLLAADERHAAGSTGGAETVVLTEDDLPALSGSIVSGAGNNLPDQSGYGAFRAADGIFSVDAGRARKYGQPADKQTWSATDNGYGAVRISFGGNQAHNNMPPYIAVYMWERLS